jgi:hypothetical protein
MSSSPRDFEDIEIENPKPDGYIWFVNVAISWSDLLSQLDADEDEPDLCKNSGSPAGVAGVVSTPVGRPVAAASAPGSTRPRPPQ